MTGALTVQAAGPGLTIQDLGRPGFMAYGLSRGGAADRLAFVEGAALLHQSPSLSALEMAGMGGEFEANIDLRIALTGAPMRVTIGGQAVPWYSSHLLPAGVRLTIGPAEQGVYGYLHVGGGFATKEWLRSRSTHLGAGLGQAICAGDRLPVGIDQGSNTGLKLSTDIGFNGGTVRMVPSLQTSFFSNHEIARFEATTFYRDARGNRMGMRLSADDEGFQTDSGLSILSEVVMPGDVQINGDGAPFVLLTECQTTGGYPRIGSVIPADLPIVTRAGPGTPLQFRFIRLEEAVAVERAEAARRDALPRKLEPLIRDPHEIADLLSYQMISGVTLGDDMERTE